MATKREINIAKCTQFLYDYPYGYHETDEIHNDDYPEIIDRDFPIDLVMLPTTKSYWYAICRSKGDTGTYYGATLLFEDKEDLLKSIDGNKIIKILSIDIEEE